MDIQDLSLCRKDRQVDIQMTRAICSRGTGVRALLLKDDDCLALERIAPANGEPGLMVEFLHQDVLELLFLCSRYALEEVIAFHGSGLLLPVLSTPAPLLYINEGSVVKLPALPFHRSGDQIPKVIEEFVRGLNLPCKHGSFV